jgi:hypothetical protein
VDQTAMDSMRNGIPGLGLKDKLGFETGGVIGKYHDMYENKMNPFEEVPVTCRVAAIINVVCSFHTSNGKGSCKNYRLPIGLFCRQ